MRVNLGLFQHDVSVIWDLAVHDLSILDHVLPARPRAVSATGMSHVAGGSENIAYLTLFLSEKLIAPIHVNWLAPVKVRRTLIGGSRKMIVYDDLEPSEKVKIYDRGISVGDQGAEGVRIARIKAVSRGPGYGRSLIRRRSPPTAQISDVLGADYAPFELGMPDEPGFKRGNAAAEAHGHRGDQKVASVGASM